MKKARELLAFALVVISVFAVSISATAGTVVEPAWATATAIGDLGGKVSSIYSCQIESPSYVVQAFQYPTTIEVKFDGNTFNWALAKYNGVTGYIPVHHFEIDNDELRKALFSDYTLSQGMSGVAVKNLQECLVQLGYSTNGIDGVYGSGTKAAVTSFQSDAGLESDGVAGKFTKLALIEECIEEGILY